MVADKAAKDAKEGSVVMVFSPQTERVIGKVNPLLLNMMEVAPMGKVLAQ